MAREKRTAEKFKHPGFWTFSPEELQDFCRRLDEMVQKALKKRRKRARQLEGK